MVKCYALDYNGQRLSYYKTNYGALFLARGLLALYKGISYCTSPLQSYIKSELTVRLPFKGKAAPICVGLKGFKQMFADRPDPALEELLISTGIVQGDLPVTEDIKVEECESTSRGSCVIKTDESSVNSAMLSEVKRLRKELADALKRNRQLEDDKKTLQKRLLRYQQIWWGLG